MHAVVMPELLANPFSDKHLPMFVGLYSSSATARQLELNILLLST